MCDRMLFCASGPVDHGTKSLARKQRQIELASRRSHRRLNLIESRTFIKWLRRVSRRHCTAAALSWTDKGVLSADWILLLAADLSLPVLLFPQVRKVPAIGHRKAQSLGGGGSEAIVRRLHSLLTISGQNHLHPMRCLPRSLALRWPLSRRSIATDLCMDIHKHPDGVHAHAWLEHGGRAIGDAGEIRTRSVLLVTWEGDK